MPSILWKLLSTPQRYISIYQSRTLVNALRINSWIFFVLYAASYAQRHPSTAPGPFFRKDVALRSSSISNLTLKFSRTEDLAVEHRRDSSPDILAASVPVSAFSTNGKAGSHPDKGFLLRSSSHNVSGIGGYTLFALPIFSSELSEILIEAQADLQTHSRDTFASSYQVNTTRWSFSVLIANTTLQRATIQAVVQRFLKISSSKKVQDDIVSTRVGVILNGSNPIADIAIMPCQIVKNSTYVPFSGAGDHQNPSLSQFGEIVKVTPSGSSCAYQVINETTALAPFRGFHPIDKRNFKARDIETEILARIGETAFAMSVRLFQREDGLPVQVKIWALKAGLFVASWQITTGAIVTTIDSIVHGDDKLTGGSFDQYVGLDSGFYVLGRLMARFVVRIVQAVGNIQHSIFSMTTWKEIISVLLIPLQGMNAFDNAWAMEGKIYGPGNTTDDVSGTFEEKNRKRRAIASWQLWIGDLDENGS